MRLGIDLGGTKIEVLVLDDDGNDLLRKRIATPRDDYTATLQSITRLIENAESEIKQTCSIGICTPGSLSPLTGLLRNSNSVCLNDKPFKQDIESILEREVRISNDANCFALSEAIDGSAQNAKIVFGVILGTGVGGGLVINKQVITGCNAVAGEWGHNSLPWSNENELLQTVCWCGKRGCIETFLSGPGLVNDYYRSVNDEIRAKKIDAKKIVQLVAEGDKFAEQILQRYEKRLAKSLAHVVNIFDPDVIVLGGGLSNIERLYSNVTKIWQKWIFSDSINTKVIPPHYGDASGVRGAAWLWVN